MLSKGLFRGLFEGWTRKEKREFCISLILTIAVCAVMVWSVSLLQSGNP